MNTDNFRQAEKLWKLGMNSFREKNYTGAVENFSEAINLYPYIASYYENRSYCYLKLKLYDDAQKDALKSIELHPNNQNCYLVISKCYIMNGKLKEATEWLNNTTKTGRSRRYENLQNLINKNHELVDLFNTGRYFQSYDKIEELLKIEACTYYKILKAVCLIHLDRFEEALNVIDKIVFEDSRRFEFCNIYHCIGLYYYYKGDFSKTSIYLQEALKLTDDKNLIEMISKLWNKSSNIETLILKGQIAKDEKKFLAALNSYNEALSIDPKNKSLKSILHFQRAKISMKIGNYTDAIKDLSLVICTETPNNVQALLLRSECFEKLKLIEDRQKSLMSDLQNERRIEANLNQARLKRVNIEEDEGNRKKMPKTCDDSVRNDDQDVSYEISFTPKESTSWQLTKIVDGHKMFYPFDNSPEVIVNECRNEENEVVCKIKLFKD